MDLVQTDRETYRAHTRWTTPLPLASAVHAIRVATDDAAMVTYYYGHHSDAAVVTRVAHSFLDRPQLLIALRSLLTPTLALDLDL